MPKISELSAVDAVELVSLVPVVVDGETKKVTVAQVRGVYADADDLRAVVDDLAIGTKWLTLDAVTSGDSGGASGGANGYWVIEARSGRTDNIGTIVTNGGANAAVRKFTGPVFPEWFGAKGDGITNDAAAIQAALTYLSANAWGGWLQLEAKTYQCSSGITLPTGADVRGSGTRATVIRFSHTGFGLKSTSPVNSSTDKRIRISDLTIEGTNASNTDGGIADVCGTFNTYSRVRVIGFKYGFILDQSELCDLLDCEASIQLANGAGVWLVNGDQYTTGASPGFTNRISIQRCQFNQASTQVCVADDGGYAHAISDCNFNGGLYHIRAAGVIGLNVNGGEYEGSAGACLWFDATRLDGSSGPGACEAVEVLGAILVPAPPFNQPCVQFMSGGTFSFRGCFFGNTSATKLQGCSNARYVFSEGSTNSGASAIRSGPSTKTAYIEEDVSYLPRWDGPETWRNRSHPEYAFTVSSLATGNSAFNDSFGLAGDGHYSITVDCIVKRATTGDYRQTRYLVSLTRISGTAALTGTPVQVSGAAGGWTDTGLTLTLTAVSSGGLGGRLQTQINNASSETVSGRVHVSYVKQDLV